jgi:hypothetical protein
MASTTRLDTNRRESVARTNTQLDQSEKTRQFYSGLDWLLEATSSSWAPTPDKFDSGTPLTEDALRQLNARRKDSCFVTEADSEKSELKG